MARGADTSSVFPRLSDGRRLGASALSRRFFGEVAMIKSVILLKHRGGRQGPSARALRRAVRPSRVKMGPRVAIFFVLFALAVGWIGFSLNKKIEKWEQEHHRVSQGRPAK
jgi:hypothetical protein